MRSARRFLPGLFACLSVTLVGCVGATPTVDPSPTDPPLEPGPVAEIADAGADCRGSDVVGSLMPGARPNDERPSPAAGRIPPDFQPVSVVECVLIGSTPSTDGSSRAEPGTSGQQTTDGLRETFAIDLVILEGDLAPLIEALARPSEPPSDGPCPAIADIVPEIFLVDDAGRAIRPLWPADSCGHALEGTSDALRQLDAVSSHRLTVEVCIGCGGGDGYR